MREIYKYANLHSIRTDPDSKGFAEELIRSLEESCLLPTRSARSMFPKARWVAEMEEVAGFVGDQENGAAIHRGAAELYQHLAEDFPDCPNIASIASSFRVGRVREKSY